jgi:hypothetical protein
MGGCWLRSWFSDERGIVLLQGVCQKMGAFERAYYRISRIYRRVFLYFTSWRSGFNGRVGVIL